MGQGWAKFRGNGHCDWPFVSIELPLGNGLATGPLEIKVDVGGRLHGRPVEGPLLGCKSTWLTAVGERMQEYFVWGPLCVRYGLLSEATK